jgi:hypothetical protein
MTDLLSVDADSNMVQHAKSNLSDYKKCSGNPCKYGESGPSY